MSDDHDNDTDNDHLRPPRPAYTDADYVVPLSPPVRPPFSTYHSMSSVLPATPRTPYLPPGPSRAPAAPFELRSSSGLPPYLTLPPRLLLTTLTPALIPLMLTIAHLFQNRSSTASLANTLRSALGSACSGLAKGAASIQTMPRYLAMQTNEEVIRATQASILFVGTALIDCVTIVEEVITFIVDTYRSMLLCTLELAIRGTLDLLIEAVQTISDSVTSSLNTVRTDIQSDISSANSVIQSAVSKINSVTSLVDVTLSVPNFTIPALSFLENVTIPTTFESSLIKLNASIPSLSELKSTIDSLIDMPFQSLIADINSTRLEMAASFNSSILPIPSLSTLAASDAATLQNQLCGDLDTSLIDDTANALHKLSTIAIGLMFFLLVLVWAALCVWEWRRWRALKNTVDTVEAEWRRDGPRDAWRTMAIVEHPILERYGSPILNRVAPGERTKRNIRWYLAYLSHPTCLALLFVASLGFLSVQFQMVALEAIKSHAETNANSTVRASTDSFVAKINAVATNSSQQYADEFNSAITTYQTRINDELFGSWLNTTAVVLNDTLVTFYDEIEALLNATFGGTILYGPVNTFIYCILGSKITNLEQGLTWVSQHAQVTLPTLPADILVLSNSSMNELVSPVVATAVGSGSSSSGDSDGYVGKLIDNFESALRLERNFYAILLGVWLGFALIGLLVVLWHSAGRERVYALRRQKQMDRGDDGGEGTSKTFWNWGNEEKTPIYDEYAEAQFRGTGTGTSPTLMSIPRIVEPLSRDRRSEGPRTSTSFFDYKTDHNPRDPSSTSAARPNPTRKTTFGSIASLAEPGLAFLRLGRKTPDANAGRLVEKGVSSEKYNNNNNDVAWSHQRGFPHPSQVPEDERVETPAPFWVNRFYGAMEGVRSFFPTRGHRHGAALGRNASVRTERSFGASQVPTAITPREDWPPRLPSGIDDSGRYPVLKRSSPASDQPSTETETRIPTLAPEPVYPRPMSRAPTLREGKVIGSTNPFLDVPPPLPNKHDSIDYLQDEEQEQYPRDRHDGHDGHDGYDGYDDGSAYSHEAHRRYHEQVGNHAPYSYPNSYDHEQDPTHHPRETFSPTSRASSGSYIHSETQVESANRVQTGTAALAAILANMQERRRRADPFSTPFDDPSDPNDPHRR